MSESWTYEFESCTVVNREAVAVLDKELSGHETHRLVASHPADATYQHNTLQLSYSQLDVRYSRMELETWRGLRQRHLNITHQIHSLFPSNHNYLRSGFFSTLHAERHTHERKWHERRPGKYRAISVERGKSYQPEKRQPFEHQDRSIHDGSKAPWIL